MGEKTIDDVVEILHPGIFAEIALGFLLEEKMHFSGVVVVGVSGRLVFLAVGYGVGGDLFRFGFGRQNLNSLAEGSHAGNERGEGGIGRECEGGLHGRHEFQEGNFALPGFGLERLGVWDFGGVLGDVDEKAEERLAADEQVAHFVVFSLLQDLLRLMKDFISDFDSINVRGMS